MYYLEIISFDHQEVERICCAAWFLQNTLQIAFSCPESLVVQLDKAYDPKTGRFSKLDSASSKSKPDTGKLDERASSLKVWSPQPAKPAKAKDTIKCFASLDSFLIQNDLTNSGESILALHPQGKILLIQKDKLPLDLLKNNVLCCLDGEAIPESLNRFEVVSHPNFRAFMNKRSDADILLTANLSLVMSCLMHDSGNWILYHPESQIYNLLADYRSDLSKALLQTLRISKAKEALRERGHLELFHSLMQLEDDSYSFFAEHYDDYMSHVNYEQWIDKVLAWQKQYCGRPPTRIIELACGTANISTRLVNRGYEVDACDLSVAMLEVANRKVNKPNLFQAGLTDPLPNKEYSLAICMFDSINYLVKSSQITKMLQEVSASLAADGLLIFDISTLNNSQENFEDLCNLQKSANGYLMHQAWFQALQMLQRSSLHYFKKQGFGYQLQVEQHTQRVYRVSELTELIARSPLELVAIHSLNQKANLYPRHLQSIDTKYPRLFFILRKQRHEQAV